MQQQCSPTTPTWHRDFLRMLPTIKKCARYAFRMLPAERHEDLVQEAIAHACVAYAHLVERGRTDRARTTILAKHAISRTQAGRRVGSGLNINDVLSVYCQRWRGITVRSLHDPDAGGRDWRESLIVDHRVSPADLAAFRIDFAVWLRTLSRRDRQIAELLATGERTTDVARRFRLADARISQLRRDFAESWNCFHGLGAPPLKAALV